MDLLKTILLYLTMVFVSSVQTAPEPSLVPETPTPPPATVSATATYTPVPTPTPTPVPTPNITPNNDYKTLKVGDKGDNVKLLQRRLAELGYYSGDVDGVFGNQTRRAVERFQYYQGLSVDGIAGKRSQTVLYESKEVVFAPVDVTPTPTVLTTPAVTAAMTTPPAATTPVPTFAPTPTSAPTGTVAALTATQSAAEATPPADTAVAATEATASAEPTVSASAEATVAPPELLTMQDFVLDGSTDAMTLAAAQGAADTAAVVLHPALFNGQVYVPFLEVMRNAGSVLVPDIGTDSHDTAYSLLNDLYQISYQLDDTDGITNLVILKNQTPQVLSLRSALLMDSVLYLPMTVTTELTGITYGLNETQTRYTVTLPTLEQP